MDETEKQLMSFIETWKEGREQNKKGFLQLYNVLKAMNGVMLEFVPREGVTYSLRAKHPNQQGKPLFVMVDVIEGEPRWLSVCFYAEMISDPDERGDFVPGGLLGEDACCFDMEEYNEEMVQFLADRLQEACRNAAG